MDIKSYNQYKMLDWLQLSERALFAKQKQDHYFWERNKFIKLYFKLKYELLIYD